MKIFSKDFEFSSIKNLTPPHFRWEYQPSQVESFPYKRIEDRCRNVFGILMLFGIHFFSPSLAIWDAPAMIISCRPHTIVLFATMVQHKRHPSVCVRDQGNWFYFLFEGLTSTYDVILLCIPMILSHLIIKYQIPKKHTFSLRSKYADRHRQTLI